MIYQLRSIPDEPEVRDVLLNTGYKVGVVVRRREPNCFIYNQTASSDLYVVNAFSFEDFLDQLNAGSVRNYEAMTIMAEKMRRENVAPI